MPPWRQVTPTYSSDRNSASPVRRRCEERDAEEDDADKVAAGEACSPLGVRAGAGALRFDATEGEGGGQGGEGERARLGLECECGASSGGRGQKDESELRTSHRGQEVAEGQWWWWR